MRHFVEASPSRASLATSQLGRWPVCSALSPYTSPAAYLSTFLAVLRDDINVVKLDGDSLWDTYNMLACGSGFRTSNLRWVQNEQRIGFRTNYVIISSHG